MAITGNLIDNNKNLLSGTYATSSDLSSYVTSTTLTSRLSSYVTTTTYNSLASRVSALESSSSGGGFTLDSSSQSITLNSTSSRLSLEAGHAVITNTVGLSNYQGTYISCYVSNPGVYLIFVYSVDGTQQFVSDMWYTAMTVCNLSTTWPKVEYVSSTSTPLYLYAPAIWYPTNITQASNYGPSGYFCWYNQPRYFIVRLT